MALLTIRLLMVVVAVALALTIWLPTAEAFLLTPPPASALTIRSDTQLAVALRKLPLVGRFRRKKKVEQVPTIQVGNNLPGYKSAENDSGDDATAFPDVIVSGTGGEPTQMHQLLSSDKAILVGMPGAFTTTCTKEHLPGYLDAVPAFEKLGYKKVAVLTTNDHFVNDQWMSTMVDSEGAKGADDVSSNTMIMVSDGDGDFVKSIGMAEDMGFGMGVRSKRFVMAVDNGVVTHIFTDEGMDDCKATSAQNVLRRIAQNDVAGGEGDEENSAMALGGGLLAALAAAAYFFGASSMPTLPAVTTTAPVRATAVESKVTTPPATTNIRTKPSTDFQLLKQFKP